MILFCILFCKISFQSKKRIRFQINLAFGQNNVIEYIVNLQKSKQVSVSFSFWILFSLFFVSFSMLKTKLQLFTVHEKKNKNWEYEDKEKGKIAKLRSSFRLYNHRRTFENFFLSYKTMTTFCIFENKKNCFPRFTNLKRRRTKWWTEKN